MIKRLTFTSLVILFFVQILISQSQENEKITISELYDHIIFLASDSLKGRQPGTNESRIAADYIRNQVKASGFSLSGENGFQYFDVIKSVSAGEKNSLAFKTTTGVLEQDFIPLSFSENGVVSAQVVFVGYGFDIDEDSLSWHDYENLNVEGKWVLVLRSDPETDNSNSPFMSYSSLRKKVLVAKDMGAAGVLFVSGEKLEKEDELIKLVFDKSLTSAGIPVIHIIRNIADLLLSKSGYTVTELEKKLNESRQPNSFEIEDIVTAETEIVKHRAKTQNIVAILAGNDPVLKEEFIVFGAHYDHLGFGGPGSGSRRPDTTAVHNGADDNASGVAAILEITEKLAANRKNLKRSLIFVAFGAEEMGILGSKYFTDNPPVNISQISCMFNLDMIGRMDSATNSLTIGGTGTAIGLSNMVEKHASNHGLDAKLSPEGYGPSDHASFYMKDIPVLYFFTNAHEDYHTPADDIDKINFEGEKKIADLVYDLAFEIANRSETLVYQEAGPKEQPATRRRFRVTLGIMPDFTGSEKKGLRADAVTPNGPAARAGMKKGDIIVAMEGKPVKDIYEYMNRLSEFKSGQRITVEVIRGEKKVSLIVEL